MKRDADGEPDFHLGYLRRRYLLYDGTQWNHRELALGAEAFRKHNDVVDARVLGVGSSLGLGTTLGDLFRELGPSVRYDVRKKGNLCEVRIWAPESARECRYLLAPERGWNPIRVEVLQNGEMRREAHSTLKKWGDTWFPERVKLYDSMHANGKEPVYEIEVLSASFNQPDDPQRLTPEWIGIDVGTHVEVFEPGNILRPVGEFAWDGEQVIPLEEYFERFHRGELERGPRMQAAIDYSAAMGLLTASFESQWERYARNFIEKHALEAAQSERVWRIVRDCQQRARRFVRAQNAEISRIRRRVGELFHSGSAATTQPERGSNQLVARMERIEHRIRRIFDEQLKPRLERIPTQAQREAAAEREARRKEPRPGGAAAPDP